MLSSQISTLNFAMHSVYHYTDGHSLPMFPTILSSIASITLCVAFASVEPAVNPALTLARILNPTTSTKEVQFCYRKGFLSSTSYGFP